MAAPTAEEAASFEWGGTRARPRKKIEKVVKQNATYLKPPGSCNSKWKDVSVSISIECCETSTIAILDTTSQVQISDCVDCRIIVGPCIGSVFLLDCTGCTISIAAKQLRLRDCSQCTLRTYAPTSESVVIETCRDLKFGSWDVAYPGLSAQFAAIPDWDVKRNFWNKIYDFSPPSEATAPKNFAILPISNAVLERQGCKRWTELTLAAEGLTGGTVTETSVSTASIDGGCECPVLSADGEKYEYVPPSEEPAAPPAAEAAPDPSGASGYARMFGGGSQALAAAPPAEAQPLKPDTGEVVLTEKATVEGAAEPTLFQKALTWLSSLFDGSSRRC